MTPAERAFQTRLRLRAARLQPDLQRRLLKAWELLRASLTEGDLTRAIRTGSVEQLINDLLSDSTMDDAMVTVRRYIQRQIIEASDQWTVNIPDPARPPMFNPFTPRVVEAIRALDTRVMDGLKEEVRATVRQALIAGVEAGQNPRTTARAIRSVIGLSPRHETAVESFRRLLESGDRAALRRVLGRGEIRLPDGSSTYRSGHAGGFGLGSRELAYLERQLGRGPIPPEKIARMVEAYRKRMLALNTETNARTIAMDAQRLAQRNAWESAIAQGTVDRNRILRSWIATRGPDGDGRNRPEHLELHGARVGFDERYPNGQLIPGETDYNCRCLERIVLLPSIVRLAA